MATRLLSNTEGRSVSQMTVEKSSDEIYCAHEICVPAAGMPPAEHENAKTRKPENGENGGNAKHENREKTKTRKRRKRAKQESRFCRKPKNITINYRTSNQRRTEMGKAQKEGNAKLENGKKCSRFLVVWSCTEAVHSVAL